MVSSDEPDFFISYNKADCAWAEWIAWELEDIGYSAVLQAWDFRPGQNFVLAMQRSVQQAKRTLTVLSPDYLQSLYCQPEWAGAFAADPMGTHGKLLPVRVRRCQPEGLLAQIHFLDLSGMNEPTAREALRTGVQQGRAKPKRRPAFPGRRRTPKRPPSFPTPEAAGGRNRYDPWTPVPPGQLVGRDSVLRELETAAAQRRSVSLVGDRRIGKTSVLMSWADSARRQGFQVVEVSGEGPEGASVGSFVSTITSMPAEENADRAANQLARWLVKVTSNARPPLLLVDEVDGLLARFEHRFFERLRGMLGEICLVFAAQRDLDQIYRDLGRTSPFYNRLHLTWLALLKPEAAEALIARGQDLLSVEDLETMRLWAGRNPFYLQLLGWHLAEVRLAGSEPAEALDRFRAEAAVHLRDLWRGLGERDRIALQSAACNRMISDLKLKTRGLIDENGRPFGRVLTAWLNEEMPD